MYITVFDTGQKLVIPFVFAVGCRCRFSKNSDSYYFSIIFSYIFLYTILR